MGQNKAGREVNRLNQSKQLESRCWHLIRLMPIVRQLEQAAFCSACLIRFSPVGRHGQLPTR